MTDTRRVPGGQAAPRPVFLLLSLLISAAAPGCGAGDSGPAVHPVAGSLYVDGKPAAGAEVVFHPASPAPGQDTPTLAVTGADGGFRPSTRLANDGAPAGDYLLAVTWRRVSIVGGEEIRGDDRLRGKYGDPRTSGLRATIRAGDNTLPRIDLTTSAKPPTPTRGAEGPNAH